MPPQDDGPSAPPDRHEGRSRSVDGVLIVRDVLRAALVRGRFAAAALPSESELQDMFGASRTIVRRALGLLKDEGSILRRRGSGTFTGPAKTPQLDDGFRGLGDRSSGSFNVVVSRDVINAPALIAPYLDLPSGAPILYLRRKTVSVDGGVVAMFTSYLTLPRAEPLLDADADLSGEYYSSVEELLGRRIQEDDAILEALPADELTACEMQVPVGTALLHRQRILRLDGGETLEYGVGYQRGDRVRVFRRRTRD